MSHPLVEYSFLTAVVLIAASPMLAVLAVATKFLVMKADRVEHGWLIVGALAGAMISVAMRMLGFSIRDFAVSSFLFPNIGALVGLFIDIARNRKHQAFKLRFSLRSFFVACAAIAVWIHAYYKFTQILEALSAHRR